MPDTTNMYLEYVDSNMDKRYPLIDQYEAGSFDMPDSFLADLDIIIGERDNPGDYSYRYHTYISSIRIYPDYVYIDLAVGDKGTVAKSDPIPTHLRSGDSIEDRTIYIRPTGSTPVNGTIVIGTCEDIVKTPGVWTLSEDCCKIFPANVHIMPTTINSLQVNGEYITGDIILESDGTIDIEYIESNNTIKFSLSKDAFGLLTDDAFMEMVTSKFGKPITTINGVGPDIAGNIQINPTDCLMVTTDATANSISFYNPCGTTCASEEFMGDTYNRINDLNKSLNTLTSFYSSVSNTLAQMGVRVSSVLEPKTEAHE